MKKRAFAYLPGPPGPPGPAGQLDLTDPTTSRALAGSMLSPLALSSGGPAFTDNVGWILSSTYPWRVGAPVRFEFTTLLSSQTLPENLPPPTQDTFISGLFIGDAFSQPFAVPAELQARTHPSRPWFLRHRALSDALAPEGTHTLVAALWFPPHVAVPFFNQSQYPLQSVRPASDHMKSMLGLTTGSWLPIFSDGVTAEPSSILPNTTLTLR